MVTWQIAFGILQVIFLFALGWFIRLLIIFRKDIQQMENRVVELEKKQAVGDERWVRVKEDLEKIIKKQDDFMEYRRKND